ncbi:MAG: single-strand DNA-binding protein [Methylococcaceae bacterium NSP1-2]|nr:single-stranded DNA-binding protein [Methylococcaceae bacterium]OYV16432.1 MAG: single-strand DNA-binding protein [Methylococcaceae bacterium NSP1-2]
MSNVMSFIGTCGRDAEVRYLPSGAAVLSVSVANNVGFGDKQQTLWVRVTLWGKRAEGNLKTFLVKGQQVFVSGELTMSEYKANDGTMRTSLELNANIIDLVGKKSDSSSQAQPSYAPSSTTSTPSSAPAQQPSGGHDNFNDAPYDDDIPF